MPRVWYGKWNYPEPQTVWNVEPAWGAISGSGVSALLEPSELFPMFTSHLEVTGLQEGVPSKGRVVTHRKRNKYHVSFLLCWNWPSQVSWGASPTVPHADYLMWWEAEGASSPSACGWHTRKWCHPTGSQQLRAPPPGQGRGSCSSTCRKFFGAGSPPGTGGRAWSGKSWGSGRRTGSPWSTQEARELERKRLVSH